jgi:hypothetical protein
MFHPLFACATVPNGHAHAARDNNGGSRMVTFRDARSVLLALTLVSVVATATAARFPDTVQRTFVVEGTPARELAALFGIAEAAETSLKLPVLDTGGMSSERNYGGLASNTIRFARQDDGLRVVIGDRWHDNETGSGKPVQKYSFTSPYYLISA